MERPGIPEHIIKSVEALLSTCGMRLKDLIPQTPTEERPPYLREPEARIYTGLSRTSLWRVVRNGELPVIRLGSRLMFDRADLDRFMKRNKVRARMTGRAGQ